ncbi:MAG: ATP synthase F0 subunit B [Alphaproteobacteria bacterium]|nr:ATP synthase F0 subunit B [Alphaproteobacteria bacterium]
MWQDPNVYVFISFGGFLILFYIYGKQPFIGILDGQIKKIEDELTKAAQEKEKATQRLKGQKKELAALDAKIDSLLMKAKTQADTLSATGREEIAQLIAQKHKEADQQIRKIKVQFDAQIRDLISQRVGNALIEWIRTHGNAEMHQRMHAQGMLLLEQSVTTNV